ncbi:MAG: DPP IV N-terminal domain-containing protein [Bacteroides sp.]|nr:DPP IV N-terminal domain-containing protein [Bacteroides sp.]MCM1471998.1 DPP IV N-terminal domain-containing protein [Bacteroides sp.]
MHRFTLLYIATSLIFFSSRAASVDDYPELDKYVGGQRIAASAPAWTYTSDGSAYVAMTDDGRRIATFDIRTGKELSILMDLDHTREITLQSINGFTLSRDGSKIMVWRDPQMIYRRSFTAEYFIYDVRTRMLTTLSDEHKRQQSPLFSPDARMVAFVADGNIYIKKLDFGSEVAVTKDGAKNQIINGVPDWTYEEEFTTTCSMAWAPDNQTLSYLRYDESKVPQFTFQLYEGYCQQMPQYALYPGEFTYKYPVAGEPNSKVTVHSYDIDTRKVKTIPLSDSKIEYIPRIAYGPAADQLMVVTLNREQTRMEIYSVNPRSTTSRSILVESWNAWLSPQTYEDIHFESDRFVIFSCRTGFQHLYAYAYNGSLLNKITSGSYDVDAYYGRDAAGNTYYRSDETGPINRTIHRMDAKGRTTLLSPANGYASAQSISPKTDYMVINYSNATTPPRYSLVSTGNGKNVRVLESNSDYTAEWASAPKPEFFTMQSDGVTLNGFIIRPKEMDPSKRYPVVMCQYSGPGSQEVLDRWSIGAENYFARAGYVVVCVDGRGTGGRGRQFMDVVYKNLGHYESIDQVAAARYAARLPYVDPNRIAIYGWSYGGYEAIMASSVAGAPYAAAVAVAPVTDWRYYDTVYAERYMLTPAQNPDGYKSSSTMTHIADRKCPLLIMHGTADDNVHLFNTIQYSSACEQQGTWADVVLFPNKNHSIVGCNSRQVVYARLLDYLSTNMR